MFDMFDSHVAQGWQCPVCRRVYSPTTPMCWYCGNESTSTSNTFTFEGQTTLEDLMKGVDKECENQSK